ncbi:MAG: tripartite tricarboxylate transporter substrate-binding protein [Pseudomonadota bacterium]
MVYQLDRYAGLRPALLRGLGEAVAAHWHAIATFALLSLGQAACAHAAYPDRPVRLVIPFPAGAALDSTMRVVGQKMAELWGQPVVIDNKPGVAGVVAVANAPANGYTLLVCAGSNIVTGPLINPRLPYTVAKNFVPVGHVSTNVPVLATTPSIGFKTVRELVALARQQPGVLNYSSSGVGSPNHLAMEIFQSLTDTSFVHIPYKGGAPSVNELIGGHVDLGIFALPSIHQHLRSGRLRALAVASTQRDKNLPDVPTLAESGITGFEYEIWYGVFAPSHTPRGVVEKVNAVLQKALADPEVARQLQALGSVPTPGSTEEFSQYVLRDTERWKRIVLDRKMNLE